jgi:hypothetical protein
LNKGDNERSEYNNKIVSRENPSSVNLFTVKNEVTISDLNQNNPTISTNRT